jgi:hypothetical protein
MFAGLELLLVEFGKSTNSHTFLEVCPACKDKVEIKCMGSIGGKTPTELKLYLFFSNLRHIEQDKVDIYVFCSIITWVVRSED